jgi:hypothetical protein
MIHGFKGYVVVQIAYPFPTGVSREDSEGFMITSCMSGKGRGL